MALVVLFCGEQEALVGGRVLSFVARYRIAKIGLKLCAELQAFLR